MASEQQRKEMALEKGLSESATYTDICNYNSEQHRKEMALEKGLSENATWSDINIKK